MNSILRIVAALALVGAIGGCAELGLQAQPMELRPAGDPATVPYSS